MIFSWGNSNFLTIVGFVAGAKLFVGNFSHIPSDVGGSVVDLWV